MTAIQIVKIVYRLIPRDPKSSLDYLDDNGLPTILQKKGGCGGIEKAVSVALA